MNTAKNTLIQSVVGDRSAFELLKDAIGTPEVQKWMATLVANLDKHGIGIDEVVANVLSHGNNQWEENIAAYFPQGGGLTIASEIKKIAQEAQAHPQETLKEVLSLGVTAEQWLEWNYKGLIVSVEMPQQVEKLLHHITKQQQTASSDYAPTFLNSLPFGCVIGGSGTLVTGVTDAINEKKRYLLIFALVLFAIGGGTYRYQRRQRQYPKAARVEKEIGKDLDLLFALKHNESS